MTEAETIALIAVLAGFAGTLIGGIGATALTNKSAQERALAARSFAVQDSARQLLVTILVEARAWLGVITSIAMVTATADRLADVDRFLGNDFVDSWSGQQLREHGEKLAHAITEAKLLIRDPALKAAVSDLGTLHDEWWKNVVDPIRDLFKAGTADKVERLRPLRKFEAQFKVRIEAIEKHATEAIESSLKP